jgi:Na+-transporting methylmalonyl-CoA/oxaloacetate decarboxylase gamma subunit
MNSSIFYSLIYIGNMMMGDFSELLNGMYIDDLVKSFYVIVFFFIVLFVFSMGVMGAYVVSYYYVVNYYNLEEKDEDVSKVKLDFNKSFSKLKNVKKVDELKRIFYNEKNLIYFVFNFIFEFFTFIFIIIFVLFLTGFFKILKKR